MYNILKYCTLYRLLKVICLSIEGRVALVPDPFCVPRPIPFLGSVSYFSHGIDYLWCHVPSIGVPTLGILLQLFYGRSAPAP